MARRVFVSEDNRARVEWRRGLLWDTITLTVDGTIVCERGWFGKSWPAPDSVRLDGPGYAALLVIGWRGIWSEPLSCKLVAYGPSRGSDAGPKSGSDTGGQSDYNGVDDRADSIETVAEALSELGIASHRAPWSEIEERYRHLARRYHPDRYASLNLPPEMVRAAEQRFHRIKCAIDVLREHRESSRRTGH